MAHLQLLKKLLQSGRSILLTGSVRGMVLLAKISFVFEGFVEKRILINL